MNQSPADIGESEVLLFETSPFGTLDAIVQFDERTVYFYLNEAKPESEQIFGTRACWVRNLDIGPLVLNENEMKRGISPMLPKTFCRHRAGQPIPDPNHLRIIWLEEGNGAALVEDDPTTNQSTTLAIIPPWSGLEGFHGYADQCAIQSPICWPMPDNPRLKKRIDEADLFWKSFLSGGDPFVDLQDKILTAYDNQLMPAVVQVSNQDSTSSTEASSPTKRSWFRIDGGQFPPRGLVQYEFRDQVVLATVGMSLCPQPAVEIFSEKPQSQRRIELAIQFSVSDDNGADQEMSSAEKIESLRNQLSGLASYPWQRFTWLGAGHTCSFNGIIPNSDSARLVHESQYEHANRSAIDLPSFRDDPINLLWLTPTDSEK